MENNIILIGFMGVGKSTVGLLLSQQLGNMFVDLDSEIEQAVGLTIPQIFYNNGEQAFRNQETDCLSQLNPQMKLVVSTGGGIIQRKENWHLMHKLGTVVYLHADWDTLVERLVDSSNRPLVENGADDKLHSLWLQRQSLYNQADVVIKTDGKSPQQVADKVISMLECINDNME